MCNARHVCHTAKGFLMLSSFRRSTAIKMGLLIVDILRVSAQFWMFSMHAAAMLFMCCSQVIFAGAFRSAFAFAFKAYLPSQKDIIDAHQGRFAPLLHLVNQGQLAVEVFFILSGFLFYNSAISADLTQAPAASRCAHFVISRCLRLWPIMIFCSILLLPSPLVPNRAAAAWTLLFASNHLPWNQQFLSWLWCDFLCYCARDLPSLTCTAGLSASMCNILLLQLLQCSCPTLPPLEHRHFWQFWQYLPPLLLLCCLSKPLLSSSPRQARLRCLYPCLSSASTG